MIGLIVSILQLICTVVFLLLSWHLMRRIKTLEAKMWLLEKRCQFAEKYMETHMEQKQIRNKQ